jgi:hypothetical protein
MLPGDTHANDVQPKGRAALVRRGLHRNHFPTLVALPGIRRPAGDKLQTRVLGRTGREVTTFGIGGVTCLLNPGDTPVALIVKAVKAGVNLPGHGKQLWG